MMLFFFFPLRFIINLLSQSQQLSTTRSQLSKNTDSLQSLQARKEDQEKTVQELTHKVTMEYPPRKGHPKKNEHNIFFLTAYF